MASSRSVHEPLSLCIQRQLTLTSHKGTMCLVSLAEKHASPLSLQTVPEWDRRYNQHSTVGIYSLVLLLLCTVRALATWTQPGSILKGCMKSNKAQQQPKKVILSSTWFRNKRFSAFKEQREHSVTLESLQKAQEGIPDVSHRAQQTENLTRGNGKGRAACTEKPLMSSCH